MTWIELQTLQNNLNKNRIGTLQQLLDRGNSGRVGVLLDTDEVLSPLRRLNEVEMAHISNPDGFTDFDKLVIFCDPLPTFLIQR